MRWHDEFKEVGVSIGGQHGCFCSSVGSATNQLGSMVSAASTPRAKTIVPKGAGIFLPFLALLKEERQCLKY